MKENRVQAALVTVIVIGIAYALSLLTGSLIWTIFYFGLFLLSLHQYFLPTRYRLTREFLEIRRPWRSYRLQLTGFRSFTETKKGIQLNRMEHESFLDRMRGVYVLTGEHHATIVSALGEHLKKV